jgi:endonuclease G
MRRLLAVVALTMLFGACTRPVAVTPPPAESGTRLAATAVPASFEPDVCYGGAPLSEILDVEVLDRVGFTAGFSPDTRTPLWVCYELTSESATQDIARPKSKKFSTYRTEWDGQPVAVTHRDYSHSGYDRGHMAPSAAIGRHFGRDAQLETYCTINICPQHPGLNQRCWERFERRVADAYVGQMGKVWVVTGPIFNEECLELESDVRLPSAFFKIVVAHVDDKVEMLGVIMPNERTDSTTLAEFVYPIDEIEAHTGLDFFARLPDDLESATESGGEQNGNGQPQVHAAWDVTQRLNPVFPGSPRDERIRPCN